MLTRKRAENLFLLSPLIWLCIATFNFPDAKSVLSRLIPIVVAYCLFQFKGEWKKNLKNKNFVTFTLVSVAAFLFFTAQHLVRGETFSFSRTLLLSYLYLVFVPWQRFTLNHLFTILALGGISMGIGSVVETQILQISSRAGYAFNPIPYSTFAATILMACLLNLLMPLEKSRTEKALLIAGILGAELAVILSGTRGVWLALIATFILLAFIKLPAVRRKNIIVAAMFILSIGFAGTLTLSQDSGSRYDQTSAELDAISKKNMDTSIGIRLQLWMRGWEYIQQSPLLGLGTEGYFSEIQKDKNSGEITKKAAPLADAHFHNQYIDTMVRAGAMGLIILLSWMNISAIKSIHLAMPTSSVIVATALIFIFAGATDVPFHHSHLVYAYTLITGLLLILLPSPRQTA